MRVRFPRLGAFAISGILAASVVCASAEEYPDRPVKVVLAGSSDVTLRLFTDRMQESLGQPFVVDRKPGAGGEVAAKSVASARPDGYTLLYATSLYTLNTALGLAGYDIVKDFEPISLFGISPFTLLVHPSVPAKSVEELIALAKEKPGTLNCGSASVGSPGHLGCEMFNSMAGVKTVHVPFKSLSAALSALLGGHVQMMFSVSINARPQTDAGALRALAVTTPTKSQIVPDLPTMNATLPGFVITGWSSLVAPAGTPKPITKKLNAAVTRLLKDPSFGPTITSKSGQEPPGIYTSEQFRTFIKDDLVRWNKLIDKAGVERGK